MKNKSIFLIGFILVLSLSCNLMSNSPIATPAPTPTLISIPTQAEGTINGMLWHDVCKFTGGEAGEAVELGEGCVRWGTEPDAFGPNQTKDDFETGWTGVTIHLGTGNCPAAAIATTVTNNLGQFQFAGLSSGTYCVFYNNLTDKNDTILIPGAPTYPARGEEGFSASIDLLAGEEKTVDFGYAWEFYN
jgi:hypothetical protein